MKPWKPLMTLFYFFEQLLACFDVVWLEVLSSFIFRHPFWGRYHVIRVLELHKWVKLIHWGKGLYRKTVVLNNGVSGSTKLADQGWNWRPYLVLNDIFFCAVGGCRKGGVVHFRVFGFSHRVYSASAILLWLFFYLLKLDFCNSQDRSDHHTKTVFGWSSKLVYSFRR